MKTMPSTKAKTHFGALLDATQGEPITIEKKGRPVAVIMSKIEYEAYGSLKLEALQRDLTSGIEQADRGELLYSDEAFEGLL